MIRVELSNKRLELNTSTLNFLEIRLNQLINKIISFDGYLSDDDTAELATIAANYTIGLVQVVREHNEITSN